MGSRIDYLPRVISENAMRSLELVGDAEILLKPAAEEEFETHFGRTRSNQLVSKVTVTKFYRHTQLGYEEIPRGELGVMA